MFMSLKPNACLLCIDFINDIVSEQGKLAWKWYFNYVQEYNTISHASKLLKEFRSEDMLVVHCKVWFSPSYVDRPEHSPLFGKAKEYQALKLGERWTQIHDQMKPNTDEIVLIKNRVSAFFGTSLEALLHLNSIENIYVIWIATDLAVQSAVREWHDRDFNIFVPKDCCGAANRKDHLHAIDALKKVATII